MVPGGGCPSPEGGGWGPVDGRIKIMHLNLICCVTHRPSSEDVKPDPMRAVLVLGFL